MNKLVSKNSVQRFKQGRKIVKAEDGWTLIRGRAVQTPISFHDRKKLTHRYILAGKQYGSFDGGKTYYGLSEGGRPLSYKANNQLLAAIERGKSKSTVGARGINKSKNTVSTTAPRFLSRYSDRMSEIGGVNNIKAWQEKLKDYYDAGTYNPDSVWGDNTEKAYRKYLADNNINLGLVKLEPVSISPVKESVQQNDFASDKQNYYPSATMSTPSTETVPAQQNDFASKSSGYQSGQSRGAQLFNNITLRPEFKYGYWRMFNTNPFTIYSKQGSKLVYKNPVKRFKSNFR